MTNKYAEGYPGKDITEVGICGSSRRNSTWKSKKTFNCQYANLQPHSGAQANQAVFLALLQPHDTILGMSLASGGHNSWCKT